MYAHRLYSLTGQRFINGSGSYSFGSVNVYKAKASGSVQSKYFKNLFLTSVNANHELILRNNSNYSDLNYHYKFTITNTQDFEEYRELYNFSGETGDLATGNETLFTAIIGTKENPFMNVPICKSLFAQSFYNISIDLVYNVPDASDVEIKDLNVEIKYKIL